MTSAASLLPVGELPLLLSQPVDSLFPRSELRAVHALFQIGGPTFLACTWPGATARPALHQIAGIGIGLPFPQFHGTGRYPSATQQTTSSCLPSDQNSGNSWGGPFSFLPGSFRMNWPRFRGKVGVSGKKALDKPVFLVQDRTHCHAAWGVRAGRDKARTP